MRDLDPIVKAGKSAPFSGPAHGDVDGGAGPGSPRARLLFVVEQGAGGFDGSGGGICYAAVRAAAMVPTKVAAEPQHAPSVDVTTTVGPDGLNHVVLNLSATEKTWLSITSDGKEIFSGILEPSQTKTLTGLDVAKMRVGNAGGLEVRWNGKPIGPIGPRGQVRVVLFTPENFQILAPSQPL